MVRGDFASGVRDCRFAGGGDLREHGSRNPMGRQRDPLGVKNGASLFGIVDHGDSGSPGRILDFVHRQ